MAGLYVNDDYGLGFINVLKKEFEKLGGDLVNSETFDRNTIDLKTQLTKIKNSNPDAIFIVSNAPDIAVTALEQIKELGINADIYGSEGLKGDVTIEGAGKAAEGLIVMSVSSGNAAFIAKHQAEYGSRVQTSSATVWLIPRFWTATLLDANNLFMSKVAETPSISGRTRISSAAMPARKTSVERQMLAPSIFTVALGRQALM